MLWYIRCPGCGRVISYEMDKYYDGIEAIRTNPNLSKKEKDMAGSDLLKKLGYDQMCCRIRILGLIPYHEIIVS